jgi:hypothetical protein
MLINNKCGSQAPSSYITQWVPCLLAYSNQGKIYMSYRSSNPKSQHPNELAKAHGIILVASVRSHIGIQKSGTELESNITTSVVVYSRIPCCSFSSCNNKRVQILSSFWSSISPLFGLWYQSRDKLCLCILYRQPTIRSWSGQHKPTIPLLLNVDHWH